MSKECVNVITGFYQTVERGLYQQFLHRQQAGETPVTFAEWQPKHSPFCNDLPREAL